MSIKTLNTLLLAGVLSLVAMSAAQAGKAGGGGVEVHAAPACGDKCPVLATDGAPGAPGDKNGRSGARMATEGAPPGVGSGNGRSSAALSIGGAEFLVASIKPGGSDF
jgi:hypothetical protein